MYNCIIRFPDPLVSNPSEMGSLTRFLHEAFLLHFLIMICSQTFAISVESVVGVGSEGSWTSRTIQVAGVLSLKFSISDIIKCPFSSFQIMDGVFPFIPPPISTAASFATKLAVCLFNSDLFFSQQSGTMSSSVKPSLGIAIL